MMMTMTWKQLGVDSSLRRHQFGVESRSVSTRARPLWITKSGQMSDRRQEGRYNARRKKTERKLDEEREL